MWLTAQELAIVHRMRRSATCFAKTDVDLLVLPASTYEHAFLVGGPRTLALDSDTSAFLSSVACLRDWPLERLTDKRLSDKFVAVFFRYPFCTLTLCELTHSYGSEDMWERVGRGLPRSRIVAAFSLEQATRVEELLDFHYCTVHHCPIERRNGEVIAKDTTLSKWIVIIRSVCNAYTVHYSNQINCDRAFDRSIDHHSSTTDYQLVAHFLSHESRT